MKQKKLHWILCRNVFESVDKCHSHFCSENFIKIIYALNPSIVEHLLIA